jgi:hypothetical protein
MTFLGSQIVPSGKKVVTEGRTHTVRYGGDYHIHVDMLKTQLISQFLHPFTIVVFSLLLSVDLF